MNRLPSVVSDVFNDAMSEVAYVSQIHVILDFPEPLNLTVLRAAFSELMKKRSVFAYRFIPRFARPYWERIDETALDMRATIARHELPSADLDAATERFMGRPMDHRVEPQLDAVVLQHEGGERLVLKVNHMAADAAGTKEFTYALAHLYSIMCVHPEFSLSPERGSRGLNQVLRCVLPQKAATLMRSYFKDIKQSFQHRYTVHFPSGKHAEGDLLFVTHRFSERGMSAMGRLTARTGATINDAMITAMVHGVLTKRGFRSGEALRVMGTVDLRRYLPDRTAQTFTNLSSFFFPSLGEYRGDSFGETLAKVKATIDGLKAEHIGLGWIFGSLVMLSSYPFGIKRKIIHSIFHKLAKDDNMGLSLTNLGELEMERCRFAGNTPTNGVVISPACIPPAFFMGLSGFNGVLTLSMGFYPSAYSREEITSLMELMEEQIIQNA